MFRTVILLMAAGFIGPLAAAHAEMTGQEKIEASKTEFRVCADPDNLPFSNRAGEGFENKIAELLARSAAQPLVYYWWPARRGFINKTLNAWQCDVVIGVPNGYELTRTTQPYYCSRYVMVQRRSERLSPLLLDDPGTRVLRIGVAEHTPPLDLALRHNLDPVVYFPDDDSISDFSRRIVSDVAAGKLDVGLVWGPIGGYFARLQSVPLETAVFEDAEDPNVRLTFPVSFGVRRSDKARAEQLQKLAHDHADEIATVLRENGVPLVDPAECMSPHQHTSNELTSPVQLVAAVSRPAETVSPSIEKVAEQLDPPQPSDSEKIHCNGTETMADIQKIPGGPPAEGHPYTVVDGNKVDAKTYSGWVRFAAFCQVCHGTGGVGSAIAPDLAQVLKGLDKRQFETVVSCGLKGNLGTGVMPAWGDNPNIVPYLDNLWAYLSARVDGALGPGRPEKIGASK
jgi:mxaJ protein